MIYQLPDYLEIYRDIIESDLGGNSIENLLNDTTTNGFNNAIRATMICMCESKVKLLEKLYRDKLIS